MPSIIPTPPQPQFPRILAFLRDRVVDEVRPSEHSFVGALQGRICDELTLMHVGAMQGRSGRRGLLWGLQQNACSRGCSKMHAVGDPGWAGEQPEGSKWKIAVNKEHHYVAVAVHSSSLFNRW